jgi:hypothetical protein
MDKIISDFLLPLKELHGNWLRENQKENKKNNLQNFSLCFMMIKAQLYYYAVTN